MAIKEQKNVILQVLGHDLRTPLNNIAMSMGILAQELDLQENEGAAKLVEIVERTCRNSLDMIKQIINLEYVETQEMGISRQRDHLAGRIQNQLDTFRSLDKHGKNLSLLQEYRIALYPYRQHQVNVHSGEPAHQCL